MLILIIIVPLLGLILLAINKIFALHDPYKEKNSPFECGFHSFLAQNRTQFNISFFIFGILFLLFDLEILLVYPYVVSAYVNGVYGLIFMLIFFIALTLGFAFELGKGALKLTSRQDNLKIKSVNNISHTRIIQLKSQMILPASLLTSTYDLLEKINSSDLLEKINSSGFEAMLLSLLIILLIVSGIRIVKSIILGLDSFIGEPYKMNLDNVLMSKEELRRLPRKIRDKEKDDILIKLKNQVKENLLKKRESPGIEDRNIYSKNFSPAARLSISNISWLHFNLPVFYHSTYLLHFGLRNYDKHNKKVFRPMLSLRRRNSNKGIKASFSLIDHVYCTLAPR